MLFCLSQESERECTTTAKIIVNTEANRLTNRMKQSNRIIMFFTVEATLSEVFFS